MIHCISTVCSVVYNVVLGRGGAKALYFFLGGGWGRQDYILPTKGRGLNELYFLCAYFTTLHSDLVSQLIYFSTCKGVLYT